MTTLLVLPAFAIIFITTYVWQVVREPRPFCISCKRKDIQLIDGGHECEPCYMNRIWTRITIETGHRPDDFLV